MSVIVHSVHNSIMPPITTPRGLFASYLAAESAQK